MSTIDDDGATRTGVAIGLPLLNGIDITSAALLPVIAARLAQVTNKDVDKPESMLTVLLLLTQAYCCCL